MAVETTIESRELNAVSRPHREPIEDWLDLVRSCGAPCFAGWPPSILRAWLHWHCANRNLIVIAENDKILALGIGWQCRKETVERHWQAGDPTGDCFYFSQVIARTPAGLAALICEFTRQWPQWGSLDLYARRGPKGLLPLNKRLLLKLYRLAQRRLSKGNLCAINSY
jgi:hypothetical protein